MRAITDVYKEYKIMRNLQMHQLQVAAVAMQICESLDTDFDRKDMITMCLIHDMGNIIKFKIDKYPELNEPEGTPYWQSVQDEYKRKYGDNEHHATVAIAQELSVPAFVVDSFAVTDLFAEKDTVEGDSFFNKFFCYCDNRVAFNGVVSLEEKKADNYKRYKDRPDIEKHMVNREKNLKQIEQEVFSHSTIKPEDITAQSIAPYIERLKEFEI
jgi:hypothetical protein